MKLSKSIEQKIQSVFKSGCRSTMHNDYFYITDDKINEYLSKNLGLYSDSPEIEVGAFTFKFHWNSEQWMVK